MNLFYIVLYLLIGIIFGTIFNLIGISSYKPTVSFMKNCHLSSLYRLWREGTWQSISSIIFGGFIIPRDGKRAFSLKYSLLEIFTGVCFSLSYINYGNTIQLIFAFIIISCAIIILSADFHYQIIPNTVLITYLPLVIGWRILYPTRPWWSSFVGSFVFFVLLLIIIFISNGGMGMGDLKYFTFLGYAFGLRQTLLIFLLSTGYGTIAAIILMVLKKADRSSKIPFGPFISLATITVLFWGETIISWYYSLF